MRIALVAFVVAFIASTAPARSEDAAAPELPNEVKPKATETDKATADLAVAAALVEYARDRKSPVAMVAAVQMIRRIRTKDSGGPLGEKATMAGSKTKESGTKKTAKGPLLDPKALLDEARQWAGSDTTVVALIDREAARKAEAEGSELLYGGPACRVARVGAGDVAFWNMSVVPNTWQQITVVSDGDCDVDCWAIDQAGKVFKGDNDETAHCYVSWYTTYGGTFRIAVDNRRCVVYADYRVCGD